MRYGFAIALLALALILSSCAIAANGFPTYIDLQDGYQFHYPNGWIQVDVQNASRGVDVVFRDLIEPTENLSVIISDIPGDRQLQDLGTATDVGYRFFKQRNAIDPNIKIELLGAETFSKIGQTYYLLEFAVTLSDKQHRHDLASITTHNQQLYTFNLSTTEQRWQSGKEQFQTIVRSFSINLK
ncbi:MAG: photosystem II reaction center PsbP family protein [Cyanobacteria bacterium SBLK]|nr:photosystem II reaction center PsbP family protein [Cyanobacteria bacterium SBLK]